jgi:hypothetical protein
VFEESPLPKYTLLKYVCFYTEYSSAGSAVRKRARIFSNVCVVNKYFPINMYVSILCSHAGGPLKYVCFCKYSPINMFVSVNPLKCVCFDVEYLLVVVP